MNLYELQCEPTTISPFIITNLKKSNTYIVAEP